MLSSQSLCKSLSFHEAGIASDPNLHPSIAPATQAFVSASPACQEIRTRENQYFVI